MARNESETNSIIHSTFVQYMFGNVDRNPMNSISVVMFCLVVEALNEYTYYKSSLKAYIAKRKRHYVVSSLREIKHHLKARQLTLSSQGKVFQKFHSHCFRSFLFYFSCYFNLFCFV